MKLSVRLGSLHNNKSDEGAKQALIEICDADIQEIDQPEVITELLRLGRHEDLLISLKALQILTRLYRSKETAPAEYYRILEEIIRESPTGKKTEQSLVLLQKLATREHEKQGIRPEAAQEDPLRLEIASQQDLVSAILNVCTQKTCKYQALLLLWILTFSRSALERLAQSPMFGMLSFVSKDCKEKELRASLFIIRNYLQYASKYTFGTFQRIEELLSAVSNRGNKDDPEEQEDLQYCRERYIELSQKTSTFTAYLQELESGQLVPTPYHFSDEFWGNNLESIKQSRSEILKMLKRYLRSSDTNNIWIASNDIYRMVGVYPDCVPIIRQIGIHQRLFEILSSTASEDVMFHVMEALSVCYTREGIYDG